MQFLTPSHFKEYELIDSGNFEKLERFGVYILARPEPQAVWDKALSDTKWQAQAHAIFKKEKGSSERGEWLVKGQMPDRWTMQYVYQQMNLTFKISLSSFKHVGVFPEQATNWDYIYDKTKAMPLQTPKVLNLFAYTGIASVAAKIAGAEVTHVEAIKQTVSWAKDNMELSKADNIRWIIDDAVKFVKREIRRGNTYNGIILDPPAYGRGPEGEKWVLEEGINELLKLTKEILHPQHHFYILNLYSLGFSSLIIENLIHSTFGKVNNHEFGELYLHDKFNKKLPLGVFSRFSSL